MELAEAGGRVVGEVDEGAGEGVGDAVGGDVWRVVVLLVLGVLGMWVLSEGVGGRLKYTSIDEWRGWTVGKALVGYQVG